MGSKAYEHDTERLGRILPFWQHRLGLDNWEIQQTFLDTIEGDNASTMAETDAQWQYESATIKWYLPTIAGHSDERIEQTLVHELVHVLLSPMDDATRGKDEQCELTVERVSRTLWRAWGTVEGMVLSG